MAGSSAPRPVPAQEAAQPDFYADAFAFLGDLGDDAAPRDASSAPAFLTSPLLLDDVDAAIAQPMFGVSSLPLGIERAASTQPMPAKGMPTFTTAEVGGQASQLPPRGNLDASSNSGDLPDLATLQSELAGEPDDVKRQKEKNRVAQRRFRLRQKAKLASSAQQVQQLAAQMAALRMEKAQLEAQNRLLQHTVSLSRHHIQDTAAEQAAFLQQQERILMETGSVYWRGVRSEPLSLADAKAVTMEAFLAIFEHFLGRYRAMLEAGGKDPSTPAGRELRETVLARRREEARAAMFSHWPSAAYAWNREETAGGLQPPSLAFWTRVLDALELSAEQQEAMLAARRRLLGAVGSLRRARESTILGLSLAMLQQRTDEGRSAQERQLRDSLEAERQAVHEFLYTIVDCTFHPWQEAAADLHSHPWHPDLWALCNLLAARAGGSEPPDISAAGGGGVGAGLLPHFSPAEMLWTPMLARGGGLQLKRVLVAKETPADVLAQAARPLPSIAQLRRMTMFEIFCGKHLELPAAEAAASVAASQP